MNRCVTSRFRPWSRLHRLQRAAHTVPDEFRRRAIPVPNVTVEQLDRSRHQKKWLKIATAVIFVGGLIYSSYDWCVRWMLVKDYLALMRWDYEEAIRDRWARGVKYIILIHQD